MNDTTTHWIPRVYIDENGVVKPTKDYGSDVPVIPDDYFYYQNEPRVFDSRAGSPRSSHWGMRPRGIN